MTTEHQPKLILGFRYWELSAAQKEQYDHDWLEDSRYVYITDADGDILCIGYFIKNIAITCNISEKFSLEIKTIIDEFGITPYIFSEVYTY